VYLYERNYSRDIILGGVLHDALEWSGITEEMLKEEFGDRITALVRACTKDDSIKDPKQKIDELIGRCADEGGEALIIKAADILDSFAYYTNVNNEKELLYCARNVDAIFRFKPEGMADPIFDELKKWHERYVLH
jgi:(p)ppGpp synthase/HD superfamily hydrolase